MRFSDSKDFFPSLFIYNLKQCFKQPAASFLVCSLIFIEYKKIRKSPVPQDEEQGFLSFNYSSVPRKFLATRAARTPPTIGARMKIQTC